MGPGKGATPIDVENAYQLGKLIAQQGWVLLSGGRNCGVMDASSRGAKSAGGLTLGVLPHNNTKEVSPSVDIAIVTDLGSGRNNINVLSSDVVIACGMGLGTASEVALALKNEKSVVLLTENQSAKDFFSSMSPSQVFLATNPANAIDLVKQIVGYSTMHKS